MSVVRCYDRRDGELLHEETLAYPLAVIVAWLFPRVERAQARLWPSRFGHLPPTVYIVDADHPDYREEWRP